MTIYFKHNVDFSEKKIPSCIILCCKPSFFRQIFLLLDSNKGEYFGNNSRIAMHFNLLYSHLCCCCWFLTMLKSLAYIKSVMFLIVSHCCQKKENAANNENCLGDFVCV